ncbi:FecCD family ABC transporter permease [Acrocarpospora catenulata]|uniref:FecCD family ABC transporter permease n=1 Tax=Acrocarpospora catenulata TaxID=2836182 RepID=UPI001BDA0835|nr:iron ABC transporter permease [Acrocarpospora catenulata]
MSAELAEVAGQAAGRVRGTIVIAGLAVALVAVALAAAGLGAYPAGPAEIAASLGHRLGLDLGALPDPLTETVLWDVRLPRVLLGLLVGSSLGVAGALMQGIFHTPLAEPGVIGISSGAALGAALSIFVGFTALGAWSVSVAAFAGGLVAVLAVYGVSRAGGRTQVITLLLSGIALNAFTGAVIGLLTYFSDNEQLRSITFWQLGSLGSATWSAVAAVAPFAIAGLLLAPRLGRPLDLLSLGERSARHLGVDVQWLRLLCVVLVALLSSAAVAVAGIITFVGLIIPHLIRMACGPYHGTLLPASALGGALMLTGGDLIARTVAAPAEVPLGVLTALVGSPFFFWLLLRTRARQGGWA